MTLTRSHLRQALQDKGFTYRKAKEIVSAIFSILSTELKKGGTLDLPFGKMTPSRPTPKRAYRLNKIVRIYTKPKVHFRSKND